MSHNNQFYTYPWKGLWWYATSVYARIVLQNTYVNHKPHHQVCSHVLNTPPTRGWFALYVYGMILGCGPSHHVVTANFICAQNLRTEDLLDGR